MKRLSPTDASFLSIETDVWPTHVGGLIMLDSSEAPDFGFERIREVFARRIGRVPKFTWKLKEAPLALHRPCWMDGGEFDIDEHLQRVFVPSPAGPREIGEVAGELMSRRLDRQLPLWRIYFLDGLPKGTGALFSMYHHAVMDGTAGASLGELMMDLEPNPAPDAPVEASGPPGRDVSDLESVLAGGLSLLATPLNLGRFAAAVVRRGADLAPVIAKQGLPSALRHLPPRTPFNGAIGSRRALAFVSVTLDDVKSVSKRVGVSVNDVVIALCASGMEGYIEHAEGAIPSRPFSVMVPVSTRSPDDRELTNRVSAQPIAVPTSVAVADPVERLRAISAEMDKAKRLAESCKETPLPSAGELVPPLVLRMAARALPPLSRWLPVFGNTLITSVRGTPLQVYVAGARVTGIYSSSIIVLNMGVNFTALSSGAQIDIGITVDPDLVSDPWLLAQSVPDALKSLMRGARAGRAHPVPLFAQV